MFYLIHKQTGSNKNASRRIMCGKYNINDLDFWDDDEKSQLHRIAMSLAKKEWKTATWRHVTCPNCLSKHGEGLS